MAGLPVRGPGRVRPAGRAACLASPLPTGGLSSFADVPTSDRDWQAIRALFNAGSVAGCQTTPVVNYCPNYPADRSQLVVCIGKAAGLAAATSSPFRDLPYGSGPLAWAAPWATAMYSANITAGGTTSPLNYCPTFPTSREQMAACLIRAFP